LYKFLCLALGLFALGIGLPSNAQVSAAISGRVLDPSGAVVAGAIVTVRSIETGASRTVTTDDSGDYTVLGLSPGPQELTAAKSGFNSLAPVRVTLVVGQEAVVNFSLEVGKKIAVLTVTDRTPVVNTTTSSVSGVVGEQQIKELPLDGRSFDNLITLNPGAVNYGAMKSAGTTTSDGNTFTVDGRRTYENLFLMNGIEYTGASQLAVSPGGVSGELLGIDAIREFNVLTDTYGAEYGKRAGAQVNVVTQSGTNQLHGSLFEFTAIWTLVTFSTLPRFRRSVETSSAARWEALSRKTSGSCSATMKDFGRCWRRPT
jgi:hypothetical protein